MRRTVIRNKVAPSAAVAVLEAERAAWKQRMASKVELSPYGRPLCQRCGKYEAQHTGRYRANGSAVLRKREGLYTCVQCHSRHYDIPRYWGPMNLRDHDAEAF